MNRKTFFIILCTLITSLSSASQQSSDGDFERRSALEISQAAIDNQVDDLHFTDSRGQSLQLADLKGNPLVISLIYTSCHHICPTITKNLNKVVDKARDALGDNSFNVITVGFDSRNDNAAAMYHFAQRQSVSVENWKFLAADAATIETLSLQLGFQFTASPKGFDHLLQTTILDADMRVNRQVYGMDFDTPHVVEPLKQLIFGEQPEQSLFQQVGSRIRLFCTVYDPATDSYKFDYSIFVGLFMGLSLSIIMVSLLVREWRFSAAHDNDNQ